MRHMNPRIGHRRTAIVGLALACTAMLSACLGPLFPGECSDEERAAFESFDHYGADPLVPDDDGLGGCRGTFASVADSQDVIEHYEAALGAADWDVDRSFVGPILDQAGTRLGSTVDLEATMGSMVATVTAELLDDELGQWVVIVRRVSQ